MRIEMDSTPFEGRTSARAWRRGGGRLTCKRCGSSLAGRFERRVWRTIASVRYEIDVFRCPCSGGSRREVRRPVEEGAATG